MDTIKATTHISLGGTMDEWIALHGALSEQEIEQFKKLEQQIKDVPDGSVVWIPSDF